MQNTAGKIFSIPYNGAPDFIDRVIKPFEKHIAEVYYPLSSLLTTNARIQSIDDVEVKLLAKALDHLNIRSVGLLNGGWFGPEAYSASIHQRLLDEMRELNEFGMHKVMITSSYYGAIDFIRRNIDGIQLSASINQMLDTYDKVITAVDLFYYDEVVIDRSFNRDLKEFERITSALRARNVQTKILVNEGCLYHCPFKAEHEALCSMASYQGQEFNAYREQVGLDIRELAAHLNSNFGCIKHYLTVPWYFLKSPFIRPEDLKVYLPYVDLVKIGGRSKSTSRLRTIIQAYVDREYHGDISELMDSYNLSERSVNKYPNDKLGGLLQMTDGCSKDCLSCQKCERLYNEIQG